MDFLLKRADLIILVGVRDTSMASTTALEMTTGDYTSLLSQLVSEKFDFTP
jgi:hypothetical protein